VTPPPRLLWLAFASFVAYGLPGGALGLAWLSMQRDFGRSLEALGLLLAVLMLGNLVSSASSGSLASRFSLGAVCLAGSLGMALGLSGFALAPTWGWLLAATLLLGLGMGLLNAGVNTFAAHHFRTSRMNWLHAFYGLGSSLAPLLVTVLVIRAGLDWRLVFALFAALQLAVSLGFAATLKGWQVELPEERGAALKPRALGSLRRAAVWLMIGLFFVHNGLALSAGQFSGTLLVDGRGWTPERAGVWVSAYFFAVLLGRALLGLLGDRIGPRRLLRAATITALLGAALLTLAAPIATMAGLVLLGLALAPVYPTGMSRAPALVGPRHAAAAIGFIIAGGAIGSAVTPWLLGLLTHPLGLEVVAFSFVLLAALQLFIHEHLLRREARPPLPAPLTPQEVP
jgi:fucose permease